MAIQKQKCRECPNIVELDVDESSMALLGLVLGKWSLACKDCQKKAEEKLASEIAERNYAEEQSRLAALESQWEKMCPVAFRTMDPLKVPPDARLGNAQARTWKFGPTGLILFGPTGKSKTRTAWVVLRELWLAGRTMVCLSANEFAIECAVTAMDSAAKAAKWIWKLKCVDIFFIDDLGKRKMTDFAEGQFFDVLDHRCSHGRPMLITSEDTGKVLKTAFSDGRREAILRRIVQHCEPVSFGAPLKSYEM